MEIRSVSSTLPYPLAGMNPGRGLIGGRGSVRTIQLIPPKKLLQSLISVLASRYSLVLSTGTDCLQSVDRKDPTVYRHRLSAVCS